MRISACAGFIEYVLSLEMSSVVRYPVIRRITHPANACLKNAAIE